MHRQISRVATPTGSDRRYRFPSCLGMITMIVLMSGISEGSAFNLPWGQSSQKQSETKKFDADNKDRVQASRSKMQIKTQPVKAGNSSKDSGESSWQSVRVSEGQQAPSMQKKVSVVEKNKEPEGSVTANASGGGGGGFTLQKMNQLQKLQKLQSREGANLSGSNLSSVQLHRQVNQMVRVENQIRLRQGERVEQLQKIIETSKIHQQILATLEKKNESGNKVDLTVSDTDEILRQEKIRLIREETEKNKEFVQALAQEEPQADEGNPAGLEPKDDKDIPKIQRAVGS